MTFTEQQQKTMSDYNIKVTLDQNSKLFIADSVNKDEYRIRVYDESIDGSLKRMVEVLER